MMTKFRIVDIIVISVGIGLIIFGLFFILYGIFPQVIVYHSLPTQSEIDNITKSLVFNTTNIYDIAKNTSKFVYETIDHKTFREDSHCNLKNIFKCYIRRYPFIRVLDNQTIPYLLNSKVGACGEHANLYSYLMTQIGINTPVVYLFRDGTHAINELRVNDSIVIIDPSDNVFNEPRENEMFPNKQIRVAELIYLNGTKVDYTRVYAKESTGEISIQFLFFNKPLRNFSLIFYSGVGIPKTTDQGGYINAPLGNYTYNIRPQNLMLRPLFTSPKIKVVENRLLRSKVRFKFSLLFYLLWLLLFCLAYEYFLKRRKAPKNRQKHP